ncbi:MAG TPA: sugar phosphate nucleotidyltransferase [Pyrinomonadaceae bacterium]|jgi:UTP--glucose-1-phosphate uridylyltransferase|nr:sugar phosphate nucleotidyltransferase [Pyrinomonadaceae bacterium]
MKLTRPVQTIIEKAVIPAAGLGSRMLPFTKAVPKELLPVGRKPMIQHVLEEALLSGVKRVCIVIREGKEIIRDYLCAPHPESHKRDASIDELERLVDGCELSFVYQTRPAGLGDAIFQAREFVADDPFVVMIPDQLLLSGVPATLQLIEGFKGESSIRSSLLRLPKGDVPFFAGARGVEFETGDEAASGAGPLSIRRLQTEEETRAAYRDSAYELRGFGRTVYPPEIFDYLGPDFVNPRTAEVDLWKTFEACALQGIAHRGVVLEGEPLDLGTFEGYYHYLPRFRESNS